MREYTPPRWLHLRIHVFVFETHWYWDLKATKGQINGACTALN